MAKKFGLHKKYTNLVKRPNSQKYINAEYFPIYDIKIEICTF